MPLRVGILTFDFFPFIGGQGRVTYDLWRRLRRSEELHVTAISPSRNGLPDHVERYAFTQRVGRHPLFSPLASFAVRKWCRSLQLDVLHVNGGPGGVLLMRDPGVPVVYSLYHTYEQAARLMPGHGWKSIGAHLERAAYKRAASITASTASTAASLRDRLRLHAVDVIPCGIDFDAFPQDGRERDRATVLFVGRLDDRKNPRLLIDAFATVARTHPDARLVMLGTGPLESSLTSRANALGIGGRVQFDGRVSHDLLVDWYNRATLVVVPSLFEGFGLSAVEAQACGAPVIATDSEGLRDVIHDGETGLLTQPTPVAVAEAIAALLDYPARRQALAAAGSTYARTHYAWPPVISQFEDVYRRAA